MRGAIGMGAHCSKTDPRALSKRRRSAAVGVCRVSEGPVRPDLPFFKAARNPGFSTVNSLTKHGLSTVQFTSTGWIRWALHESETTCPPGLLPGPVLGAPRGCQAAGSPPHRLKGASFSSLHQKTSLRLLWSPESSITTCPSPPRT